jgi:3-phenylpropionate/cinnamic acid dioxygenase small subunit
MKRHRLASDLCDATQAFFAAVAKIVDHRNLMSGIQQFNDRVAADVPGSARNQNLHGTPFEREASSLAQSTLKTTVKLLCEVALHAKAH